MRTKRTQKEKIIALLSDGQWHSTIELHAICWRYGARLWDLREDGYVFAKRRIADPRIEEWRLAWAPTTAEEADSPPPDRNRPTAAPSRRSRRTRTIGASGNARPPAPTPETVRSDGQLSLIGAGGE